MSNKSKANPNHLPRTKSHSFHERRKITKGSATLKLLIDLRTYAGDYSTNLDTLHYISELENSLKSMPMAL